MLDSNESDDEGDIENIMNDSDTEFVAENESVISANIIRKEEIVVQSSSITLQLQKHQSTFCLAKTEKKIDTLGQNEPNSAPTTQRTSNQPPSPAPQRTSDNVPPISHLLLLLNAFLINHLLLPLNVLPISHLLLLLFDVLPISYPNLPLLQQLLYPKNTEKRKQRWMIKDKTKKKNFIAPSDEKNTNQEKGSLSQDKDKTKNAKTNKTEEWK